MKQAKRLFGSVLLAGLALAVSPIVMSAALVAPHAVFIDHRERTGQLTIANPGDEPEEIEIEFVFGYPATDSLGNPYVELIEDPGPDQPSAAEWMRAFPRRLRLEPGQRQVVRVLASPPADLPDGEHWSRIIITSRREPPVAVADTAMRAGITLELRTIISLTYRKGAPQTGVILTDLNTRVEGDSLVSWIGLERDGNAAFLGSLKTTLLGDDDTVVQEWSIPIAVYYDVHRRLALPLQGIPAGDYRVRFDISTAREDISQTDILPADAITRTFMIEVT